MRRPTPRLVALLGILVAVAGACAGLLHHLYPRGIFWEPPPPITHEAQRAVVRVEGWSGWGLERNEGAGVIFAPGRVLTAWHILDGCDSAEITLTDGATRETLGVVSGHEPADLIVLAFEPDPDDPHLELTSFMPNPGDAVTLIPTNHLFRTPPRARLISIGPDPEYGFGATIAMHVMPGMSGSPVITNESRAIGLAVSGSSDGLGYVSARHDDADPFSTAKPQPLRAWMTEHATGHTPARSLSFEASNVLRESIPEAVKLIENALELAPDSYLVRVTAAEVFIHAGRLPEAEDLISRSIIQEFGSRQLYLESMLVAARKGLDLKDSEELFYDVIAHPDHQAAWAYMLVMAGRNQMANHAAETAAAWAELNDQPTPGWTIAFRDADAERLTNELLGFALQSAKINAGLNPSGNPSDP